MNASGTTVALIQNHCHNEIPANLEHTISGIRKAAAKGARIILLQELFAWPYFCRKVDPDNFQTAETIPGPITRKMGHLAAELQCVIVVPIFEKRAPGVYHNSALVIDSNGEQLGTYRKTHIPDDPGFHEKYYFTPGDSGYLVCDTRFGRIGVLICWDQWFPEAARITAMMGADLLIYPTAIASLPEEAGAQTRRYLNAWKIMHQSHAIANGCYVASINRVGREGPLDFWGHSFLCDPFGEILAEAGPSPQTILSDVNTQQLESWRIEWPFFRDRRIDTYAPLSKRWLDAPADRESG